MILAGDALFDRAAEVLDPFPGIVDGLSVDVHVEDGFTIEPGTFHVAATAEDIDMPRDMGAMVTGRSSHMREGVYMPGGWLDPGYRSSGDQPFVLEFFNIGEGDMRIASGEAGARLVFFELRTKAPGYSGRWQG